MQKLLDAIEQGGFRDADGVLLTNTREWHDLRLKAKTVIEYAAEADRIVKMLEEQRVEGARV